MKLFYKEKQENKRIIHILGVKFSYKKKPKIPVFLKQDKNSQIEFYLIDSFEIFHFLPIYKELLAQKIKARIVAEPCAINTSKNWFDYKTAIKILKENKIDYCTKANPNAKIAITTQRVDLLSKYKNKKAVLSYGIGLNNGNFSISKETCKNCDIRLVHGEYQKQILSKYMPKENIHITGYPKHDKFFQNKPKKQDILDELNIKTNKPIIVYLPTWDEDSSIQAFANAINNLRNKYFIVTKAHHCTFRLPDKKEDLKKLYEISDIVLEGNFPFEKTAILGNIVLTDAKSGSTTETVFLNNDIKHLALNTKEDAKSYYVDKLFEFTDVVSKPNMLSDALENCCKKENEFPKDYFYKSTLGNDSKIACDILIKILNEGEQ